MAEHGATIFNQGHDHIFVRQTLDGVAPAAHHHAIISEVRAEASASRMISGLSLRLPKAFGDVLVVWYQPQQQVLQAGTEGQLRFTDPAR